MSENGHRPLLVSFFLDGAKIIFASVVVGAFIPSVAPVHWQSVGAGVVMIFAFLAVATFMERVHNTIAQGL